MGSIAFAKEGRFGTYWCDVGWLGGVRRWGPLTWLGCRCGWQGRVHTWGELAMGGGECGVLPDEVARWEVPAS